jgi:hypothetical protein
MKIILKIEELAMLALSVYLFSLLDIAWWWFLVLFLAPDIGLIPYAFNKKAGAITYNILHSKAVAIAIYFTGILLSDQLLMFVGLLILGHASFDRLLGYGLKHFDSFQNTHLGPISKRFGN